MSSPTPAAYESLAREYRDRHKSDMEAAVAFACDLMRGDPRTYKAGYTLENAVLATCEVFGLVGDRVDTLRHWLSFTYPHGDQEAWYEFKAWVRVKARNMGEARTRAEMVIDSLPVEGRKLVLDEDDPHELDDDEMEGETWP